MKKSEKSKRAKLANLIMQAPLAVWMIAFVLAPFALLAFMSFMTKGPLGIIQYKPTITNYKEMFNPVYATVIKQSLVVAVWTTLLTVLMGYPLASFIAKVKAKTSSLLTVLLMLPL